MVRTLRYVSAAGGLAVLAILVVGCSNSDAPPAPAAAVADAHPNGHGEEHGHKPSARGGLVVPIGGDRYHAEVVFEKGGTLRLYLLGKDESTVLEVESQTLKAHVRLESGTETEPLELVSQPQPGDGPNKTSQFVGQLPRATWGKPVVVTIPSIRIGGERLRLAFVSSPAGDGHEMPAPVGGEDERKLYLTPGGKYTAADIKANGNQVASVKFKGLKATHDVKPKPGDRLCPVSMTKANPKFTWIVGGKSYEFCCPPCVDEFVTTAKENPDEIKDPEFYVKK